MLQLLLTDTNGPDAACERVVVVLVVVVWCGFGVDERRE